MYSSFLLPPSGVSAGVCKEEEVRSRGERRNDPFPQTKEVNRCLDPIAARKKKVLEPVVVFSVSLRWQFMRSSRHWSAAATALVPHSIGRHVQWFQRHDCISVEDGILVYCVMHESSCHFSHEKEGRYCYKRPYPH